MADGTEEVLASDVHEMRSIFEDFTTKASEAAEFVERLKSKVSGDGFSTEQGIGFLTVKNHLLLSYNIDLCLLMLRKLEGKLIAQSAPLHRLVEVRVLLEKLHPLDQKFRYQIDKAIRAATSGVNHEDSLNFKANPHNLAEESGSEDNLDYKDGLHSPSQPRTYIPPKVMAMPYAEDSQPTSSGRSGERRQRRALHSSLLRELRGEYSEAPQEEGLSAFNSSAALEREAQEEYEEENFVRLPTRRKGGGRGPSSTLDEVVQFGNGNARLGEGAAPKKPKRSLSRKAKKRGFHRLRHRMH